MKAEIYVFAETKAEADINTDQNLDNLAVSENRIQQLPFYTSVRTLSQVDIFEEEQHPENAAGNQINTAPLNTRIWLVENRTIYPKLYR